jgi:hypothetical protein
MFATQNQTVETPARSRSKIGQFSSLFIDLPVWLLRLEGKHARLQREYRNARVALGKKMYACDIDDGETGEKILDIDLRIRLAKITNTSWEQLEALREELFVRLADAALENDAPLPGADQEFEVALGLKQSLELDPSFARAE